MSSSPPTTAEPHAGQTHKPRPRLLLVDDNEMIRLTLSKVLEDGGFTVATAGNVKEALHLIGTEDFDALLSDLHMPGAGDGLTVVSAMRHHNPKAITIIFSGYPEMKEAAAAILLQADEILVKPMSPPVLIETIKKRLQAGPTGETRVIKTVADILEEATPATIADWVTRVEQEPSLMAVPLPPEERSAYLPHLFGDLVRRLRTPSPLGSRALVSKAAAAHGLKRREQGYTAAMIVEESRMLQVSIFQTLQNHLHVVDFSLLLLSVMEIADEVDSQLAQQMASYIAESKTDNLPTEA